MCNAKGKEKTTTEVEPKYTIASAKVHYRQSITLKFTGF